ncbi:MAG: TRL-like family protein [Thermodesulfovibrionales bacterium]|nr:TRL-like family protein [Thermodesulfovibrionales bacterium]
MMRRIFGIILVIMLVSLSACASYLPVGTLYTGGKMGVQAGSGPETKTGKACMQSILGLIAVGDASIDAAKAAGGIKEVTNINYEVQNILGIYGTYCLVVTGR